MSTEFDVDAYFTRIGYGGSRAPTLDTLRAIVWHHTQAIAFENLDPLLRRPVRLDIASLQHKLLHGGRGGYCFEHNGLLLRALETLGYEVSGLAARVLWNAAENSITPRAHMLLKLEIGGSDYVVDVGFGGLTLTGVLALRADETQPTPHGDFRLTRGGGDWWMQGKLRDTWRMLYRFDLQRQYACDYEAPNWYTATHASSHFLHNLLCARVTPHGRYALFNRELTEYPLQGPSVTRVLNSGAEIAEALSGVFKITLPQSPEVEQVLNMLAAADRAQ